MNRSTDALRRFPSWLLTASAVALAGVLVSGSLSRASELGTIDRALAGTVSSVDGLTVLTAATQGEDLIYVLDHVEQRVLVYRLANGSSLSFIESVSLPRLFLEGRRRYGTVPAGGGR